MILKDSTFPATLSEKIADEWWLMWTASEWKEILGAENENDAVEFLYKVIGISCRVPKSTFTMVITIHILKQQGMGIIKYK